MLLRKLVEMFNCDEGHSEEVYNAVRDILAEQLGDLAASKFSSMVSATDGMFYFRDPDIKHWPLILIASMEDDWKSFVCRTGQVVLYTDHTVEGRDSTEGDDAADQDT